MLLLLLYTEQVMEHNDLEQINDADESMSVENSDTQGNDTQGSKSSSSSSMSLISVYNYEILFIYINRMFR